MRVIPLFLLFFLCILAGCQRSKIDEPELVSLQLIDRNGFSELINSPERLKRYSPDEFDGAQPYKKVSRVYKTPSSLKNGAIITSYYENGGLWQSLQVVGGRAHGKYLEWHENGTLHIEGNIIEGTGDLTDDARESWIFEGLCKVWSDKGVLLAEIHYEKGVLNEHSNYYSKEGKLEKVVPFENDLIHGTIMEFSQDGSLIGETEYERGLKNGASTFLGDESRPFFEEKYERGMLQYGDYLDFNGELVSSIRLGEGIRSVFENGKLKAKYAFNEGFPEGEVLEYDKKGQLQSKYHIKNGKKHGEEWVYFAGTTQPKLYLNWYEDEIHGLMKTWHPSGSLESQRDYHFNKKNGNALGWYKEGNLMYIEEYENDLLSKGSYMKKGESAPVSKVENGSGIATLYDADGFFLRKTHYAQGAPLE